ncbi:MAG: ABC transporter ATP-binding protein [Lachnospiraceae bacterium]|nr:ABC transporter ATP-binding protein [Lachnospiraceae bacterium]
MIRINDLKFSYTKDKFIEGVSFDVKKGEVFGFLGPSGAGKSTIQKIMIGLLPGYRGSVVVNGVEVRDHGNSFYEEIGVDFEYPSLYEKLTARENLDFFASLYSGEKFSTMELLEKVGLERDADKKVMEYSKGMKSRLSFIKSFIHKPKILFLDEPTSGLDPSNARVMKDMIKEQKMAGTTIIITTHNMEDAAELCDRVAFIVDGRIPLLDTPHQLILQESAKKVKYSYLDGDREIEIASTLDSLAEDVIFLDKIKRNELLTVHSGEPDLGDIFIKVTGRKLS